MDSDEDGTQSCTDDDEDEESRRDENDDDNHSSGGADTTPLVYIGPFLAGVKDELYSYLK